MHKSSPGDCSKNYSCNCWFFSSGHYLLYITRPIHTEFPERDKRLRLQSWSTFLIRSTLHISYRRLPEFVQAVVWILLQREQLRPPLVTQSIASQVQLLQVTRVGPQGWDQVSTSLLCDVTASQTRGSEESIWRIRFYNIMAKLCFYTGGVCRLHTIFYWYVWVYSI